MATGTSIHSDNARSASLRPLVADMVSMAVIVLVILAKGPMAVGEDSLVDEPAAVVEVPAEEATNQEDAPSQQEAQAGATETPAEETPAEETPAEETPDAPVEPPIRWERVRVRVEAHGELFAPAGEDGKEVRRPFTSTARFDFLEAAKESEHAACVRHFFSAASELAIAGTVTRRSLRPSSTTLAVASRPAVRHFSIDGPLTREEAELLSFPFDPLIVEQLIASTGGDDPFPAERLAALLAIDTVGRPADREGATDAAETAGPPTAAAAGLRRTQMPAAGDGEPERIRVEGRVEGAVDGVPTTIDVDGTLEVVAVSDRIGGARRVRGGFVKLRERRLAGHVSPGFECEATVQIARRPADVDAVPAIDPKARSTVAEALAEVSAGNAKGSPDRLIQSDPGGRFVLTHDARWRSVADDARGLVLRLVDEGALLAECSVAALPPAEAGTELEAFKEDIARSLGASLGRFTAAEEEVRPDGCRHLRFVSEGKEGDVPLEWRHHLLESPRGRRVTVTFVVERRFAGRFGSADAAFLEGTVISAGAAP